MKLTLDERAAMLEILQQLVKKSSERNAEATRQQEAARADVNFASDLSKSQEASEKLGEARGILDAVRHLQERFGLG